MSTRSTFQSFLELNCFLQSIPCPIHLTGIQLNGVELWLCVCLHPNLVNPYPASPVHLISSTCSNTQTVRATPFTPNTHTPLWVESRLPASPLSPSTGRAPPPSDAQLGTATPSPCSSWRVYPLPCNLQHRCPPPPSLYYLPSVPRLLPSIAKGFPSVRGQAVCVYTITICPCLHENNIASSCYTG